MLAQQEIKGGKTCQKCGRCCKRLSADWIWFFSREILAHIPQDDKQLVAGKLVWLEKTLNKIIESENIFSTCFWLHNDKKGYRCLIYPIRPNVCKRFSCDILRGKLGLSEEN